MLIDQVVPRITHGAMDAVVIDMETRVDDLPLSAWSSVLIIKNSHDQLMNDIRSEILLA